MKNKKLTLQNVEGIYKIVKEDIFYSYKKGNLERVFYLIDKYAIMCQTINDHFRDEDIELLIKKISNDNLGICKVEPIDGKVIFYDQIGTTICLGLQYLRALKAKGYKVLYIFESPQRKVKENLLKEVRKLADEAYVLEGKSTLSKGKQIQEKIKNYGASKLISHFSAEGALGTCVINSLVNVQKYRIVPGDHHYAIGVDTYDHFFEYRNFAIKVSVEARKIPIEKLFKLPYYPIIDNSSRFAGFPESTNGKIIILSAGSEYKFHGSSWFFDFSKWILNSFKDVVIVFLGGKSYQLQNYVKANHFENKFLLLGYRQDFVECMKHSDIFLNSYPMGGGLVGLTAINLGIPVLSHYDEYNGLQNSIRSFLGSEDFGTPISFCNDDEMKTYAEKLINDKLFRQNEGLRMKMQAQTKENFDNMFDDFFCNKKSYPIQVTEKSCNLDKRCNNYIVLQNEFLPSVLYLLLEMYGLSIYRKFPFLYGYIFAHQKIVFAWYVDIKLKNILPKGGYAIIKNKLKKYFT